MPFAEPVKVTPLAHIFNLCAPSRRGQLDAQLLELAAGPHFRFSYEPKEWAAFVKLLKAGADMNAANKAGDTVLNLLCANGHQVAALKLLELGCDPFAANNAGMTPLLSAAQAGAADVVQALLTRGADLHGRDAQGKGALDILMSYIPKGMETDPDHETRRRKTLEILLGAGLTLNTYLENRIYRFMEYLLPAVPALCNIHTLSKAAANGDLPVAQAVLAAGIHPDAPAAYGDHAALNSAAYRGDLAMMEAALAAGANIDLASGGGKTTALQRAVLGGQKDCFARLLAAGANPDLPFGLHERNPLIMIAKDSRIPGLLQFVGGALFDREPDPMVPKKDITVRPLRFKHPSVPG